MQSRQKYYLRLRGGAEFRGNRTRATLPQSRRSNPALASLDHRDFKDLLLLQWRKGSGRWQSLSVANRIKQDASAIDNYKIK